MGEQKARGDRERSVTGLGFDPTDSGVTEAYLSAVKQLSRLGRLTNTT